MNLAATILTAAQLLALILTGQNTGTLTEPDCGPGQRWLYITDMNLYACTTTQRQDT